MGHSMNKVNLVKRNFSPFSKKAIAMSPFIHLKTISMSFTHRYARNFLITGDAVSF